MARAVVVEAEYAILLLVSVVVAVVVGLYYLGLLARQGSQAYPELHVVGARAWLVGGGSGGQVVQVEVEVEDSGTSNATVDCAGIVTPGGQQYYAQAFSPVTLSPGEIAQLSFNVTVPGGGLSAGEGVYVFVGPCGGDMAGAAVALAQP